MITNGIGAGLVAFATIKTARGKAREIGWLAGTLAIVFTRRFQWKSTRRFPLKSPEKPLDRGIPPMVRPGWVACEG